MEAGMRYWETNETDNKGGIVVKTMKEERKYQEIFSDNALSTFLFARRWKEFFTGNRRVYVMTVFTDSSFTVANTATLSSWHQLSACWTY